MKKSPRLVAGTLPAALQGVRDTSPENDFMRSAEWGRKAILTGWSVAMLGIVGYVYTMLHAPQDAGIIDSIRAGGAVGWGSALLILAGVVSWLAGNVALMRSIVDRER